MSLATEPSTATPRRTATADQPPRASRWRRWFPWCTDGLAVLGAAVAITMFASLMVRHQMDRVPEIDSQGYFLMARAFSQLELPRWADEQGRFSGHIWVDVGEGRVMTKYAPGWPLLLAIGYWIHGLAGALWVNPVLAVVGAVAFFLLAVELFNPTAAFVCTVVWLFSPMVPGYVVYPLTHGPDVTFVLLAFLFAARWARTRSVLDAGLAGVCSGFLPLIRPTNVLLWPAIALLALAQLRELHHTADDGVGGWPGMTSRWRSFCATWREAGWGTFFQPGYRSLTVCLLTFLVPVLFLAWYNTTGFGAPWRTGYSLTDEQSAFSYAQLGERLQQQWGGRHSLLEERFWVLMVVALLLRAGRPLLLGSLLLWWVPMLVLYSGYYFFSPRAVYFRFLIACLPACVLAIGFLLSGRLWKSPFARLAVGLAAAVWFWQSPPRLFDTLKELRRGRRYSYDELSADPQAALAVLPYGMPTDEVTNDLRSLVKGRAAAVYSHGGIGWTAGAEYGVVNYDIGIWLSSHFGRPMSPRCGRGNVWEDQRRHARYHAWHAERGTDGVREDFVEQVRTQLGRGLAVYLAGEHVEGVRSWLADQPDLIVDPTINPEIWRVRGAW